MKATEEKITIMKAFCEGKTIEYRIKPSCEWTPYLATGELSWNWWDNDYRIKQEPKYIPFDFTDAESLIGKPIKRKHANLLIIINTITPAEINLSHGYKISFETLLENYEFLDGSICGKLNQ